MPAWSWLFLQSSSPGTSQADGEPLEHQSLSQGAFQNINKYQGIYDQFYTPKWVKFYATAPALQTVRFISGKGESSVSKQTSNSWEFSVDAKTDAKIAIAHYYYPGWTLQDSKQKEIKITPLPGTGEISFRLPKGTHKLELQFQSTSHRILGNILSVAGLLLLVIIYIQHSGLRKLLNKKAMKHK